AAPYTNEGLFDTSTTTEAPSIAAATPSPVMVLTPRLGDAATASWPCWLSLVTSFEPMSPVPPMTTIFIWNLLSLWGWAELSSKRLVAVREQDGRWIQARPGVQQAKNQS